MCFTWNAYSWDRGGQGDPREASLKEERQKVREQRAFRGAATEAAVWPHQVMDNNNNINNNNNGATRHCARTFQALPHLFLTHVVETITIPTSQIRTLRRGVSHPGAFASFPPIWKLSVLPKPRLPGGSNSAPPSLGSLHPPCPPASHPCWATLRTDPVHQTFAHFIIY